MCYPTFQCLTLAKHSLVVGLLCLGYSSPTLRSSRKFLEPHEGLARSHRVPGNIGLHVLNWRIARLTIASTYFWSYTEKMVFHDQIIFDHILTIMVFQDQFTFDHTLTMGYFMINLSSIIYADHMVFHGQLTFDPIYWPYGISWPTYLPSYMHADHNGISWPTYVLPCADHYGILHGRHCRKGSSYQCATSSNTRGNYAGRKSVNVHNWDPEEMEFQSNGSRSLDREAQPQVN